MVPSTHIGIGPNKHLLDFWKLGSRYQQIKIYLDSFESLIKFAVKAGAKLYRERVEAKKDLKRAAARKMRATAQKRDEKKKMERWRRIVGSC